MDSDNIGCFISILIYLYISFCIFMLARKTQEDNAWWAFVPVLNIILLLQIADKPVWWIFLFFIPVVNIFMAVLIWMGVAEVRGKPFWLGFLVLIPGVNLILMGYLVFSR